MGQGSPEPRVTPMFPLKQMARHASFPLPRPPGLPQGRGLETSSLTGPRPTKRVLELCVTFHASCVPMQLHPGATSGVSVSPCPVQSSQSRTHLSVGRVDEGE